MLGLVYRLLFKMVADKGGPEAVARVRAQAGVDEARVYRMNEPYPDDEWQRIFAAACDVLDVAPGKAEKLFAECFFADAYARFPKWFEMCKTARELLELQPVIHNGFATGLQAPAERHKVIDKFRVDAQDDRIVTHYRSPNKLCGFYVALVERVLAHYGERAEITMLKSLKKGDDESEIAIRFLGKDTRHAR